MTYSLNTLNQDRPTAGVVRSGWARFADEFGLLLCLLLLGFWLLSLLTYSAQDPAWSTSGVDGALRNRVGQIGAGVADASYFLLGFSVWWCAAAALRLWLLAL
ncbi:MAG: DNA translocase FtsK, partial [Betaproteobacteria bacterium]|nr:DNA translocase FtsK [Betaproteobacteria bacterium]NDE73994.1 DNA translocase FtsK [Betaproteobacteria bacterium]